MPLLPRGAPRDPNQPPGHNWHNAVDHALHDHHAGCGHWSVRHGGHLDYLHDGHAHYLHGSHWDECPATAESFERAMAGRRRRPGRTA